MPQHPANPYSFAHEVQADGSIVFQCSRDAEVNAWLALPPHHPVVVQTQAFWTAVGASSAVQSSDHSKWSALTWIDWELGESGGGHATRGIYRNETDGDKLGYSLELFNEDGAELIAIRGRGVVFRNRNFEQWRKEAKQTAREASPNTNFVFASSADLGLTQDERVLVAPYVQGDGFIEALVTPANGFPPGNPLIGGSGDHVNSTHLHELARQALFLIKSRTDIDTSGEMTMRKYVELGAPIKLNIASDEQSKAVFEIEQLGRVCAEVSLRW